jgi:hypothetical protein
VLPAAPEPGHRVAPCLWMLLASLVRQHMCKQGHRTGLSPGHKSQRIMCHYVHAIKSHHCLQCTCDLAPDAGSCP